MSYDESIRKLVRLRLMSTPSNIKISLGRFGEFDRDQMIREVQDGTEVGNAIILNELTFIRKMSSLSRMVSQQG